MSSQSRDDEEGDGLGFGGSIVTGKAPVKSGQTGKHTDGKPRDTVKPENHHPAGEPGATQWER